MQLLSPVHVVHTMCFHFCTSRVNPFDPQSKPHYLLHVTFEQEGNAQSQ